MAGAQTSLWLDAALSSARPPAGAPQLETTNYAILGLRAETAWLPFKVTGNVTSGGAMESTAGRWLWAQAEAEHPMLKAGAYWIGFEEGVNSYTAGGVQLQRDFKFADDALIVRPLVTLARWKTETQSATYGVGGARVEWNHPVRSVLVRLYGDAYWAGNNRYGSGGYGSVGADVYHVFRGTTVGLGISQGFDPSNSETGFMVWAGREINDRLRLDAQVAHSVTDPVFGSPGSLGLTLSGSWRFHHRERITAPVLATVGAPVARGRSVTFTVVAPPYAKTVAVSGTFSDWRPIAMKRDAKGWTGTVTIPEGTHQYVFLIDGKEWFLPANAADVVDDGFGRKNVTLIVRPK